MDALILLTASDSIFNKLKPEINGDAHSINKDRARYGEYLHFFPKLKDDPPKFYEYFRMEYDTFQYILQAIKGRMVKDYCNLHQNNTLPEERLMVTLR